MLMRNFNRVLILMAAPALALLAQSDPPSRVGRLNYISGAVSMQPAGVDDWVEANLNRPLTTGDLEGGHSRTSPPVNQPAACSALRASSAVRCP